MAQALIIYGSETGNTRRAAEMIAASMVENGHEARVLDVTETGVEVLGEPYDALLLGVSTWGAIDEEVCEDFKRFYADLAGVDLAGRRVAVFGCGDTGYDRFAKAVDFVAERVRQRGATLIAEPLKIDRDPTKSRDLVETWAVALARAI